MTAAHFRSVLALLVLAVRPSVELERDDSIQLLAVDPVHGNDRAAGTKEKPLRSISGAIARSPIRWSARRSSLSRRPSTTPTGGIGMSEHSLSLMRRMRPGVTVALEARAKRKARWSSRGTAASRWSTRAEGTWRISGVRGRLR
mgnify:CR=1 FL=1